MCEQPEWEIKEPMRRSGLSFGDLQKIKYYFFLQTPLMNIDSMNSLVRKRSRDRFEKRALRSCTYKTN